jgi:hypothetical protein
MKGEGGGIGGEEGRGGGEEGPEGGGGGSYLKKGKEPLLSLEHCKGNPEEVDKTKSFINIKILLIKLVKMFLM